MQVLLTLANVRQVEELVKRVLQGESNLNLLIAVQIQKLSKVACKAIADSQIQRTTIAEILAAAKQKKKKQSHEHYGYARVMDLEVVKEREEVAKEKGFRAHWTAVFGKITPGIFGR